MKNAKITAKNFEFSFILSSIKHEISILVSSPQLNDHHQIIITLNLPDLAGGAALNQGYYWDE